MVAELPPGEGTQALDPLVRAARADRDVAYVSAPQRSPDGRAAIVTVAPRSSPQSAATTMLVQRMRDRVVPGALAGSGVTVDVGGATAGFVDQSEPVASRLPLFIAGVVGLSFLLLLSAFRSSADRAEGRRDEPAVDRRGVRRDGATSRVAAGSAASCSGIDRATPVAPFIPVMMFAVLFGLSMDYEVFLISRVREEYVRHGRHVGRRHQGLARTARVITAAAVIMVVGVRGLRARAPRSSSS